MLGAIMLVKYCTPSIPFWFIKNSQLITLYACETESLLLAKLSYTNQPADKLASLSHSFDHENQM
ncbi:hypothetical protein H5410_013273 [Solanum commersonii]|uniref:Uncharacterized protein n=1 Tax=Solanum commersonii TaxID=4109 RepID=A0A9J6AV90_SOLCO|nr:hypothetical protein H5410_013273 [Solanum commersonii]